MSYSPFDDFMNGASPCAAPLPQDGREKCFPAINGIVKVQFLDAEGIECNYEFRVYSELFVTDAFQDSEGNYFHALKGQRYEFIVKGIIQDVFTDEMMDARTATCIFLSQIEEAIQSGNRWVDTIFGLKYLEGKFFQKPKIKGKLSVSKYRGS